MGRLIDADALIESLTDWRKNWEESEDSYEKAWTLTAIDFFTSLVNEKKTAYDVEAVVAELEKEMIASQNAHKEAINKMWGVLANVYRGEKDAYKKAISIVRGKE